jgi:sulfate adenylyltransferase subunit 2
MSVALQTKPPLSVHLRQLEAEAIYVLREVAAEFRNPVLLYSMGKDSSVLLHLAIKAFYPAKLPFPLLHYALGYFVWNVLLPALAIVSWGPFIAWWRMAVTRERLLAD